LLFALLVSTGHADRATGILLAIGLFTAAIAAVVRKLTVERVSSVFFYSAQWTS
jgi:hypothetical protein